MTAIAKATGYAVCTGAVIARLREEMSWSQAALVAQVNDLAGDAGTPGALTLTQSTLSRIEKGLANPDVYMLKCLAEVFGLGGGSSELVEVIDSAFRLTEEIGPLCWVVRGECPTSEKWWAEALKIVGVPGLLGLATFTVSILRYEDR